MIKTPDAKNYVVDWPKFGFNSGMRKTGRLKPTYETMVRIDKLVRSGRKTIGLQITPDSALIVRAPKRARMADIEQAIRRHRLWIQKKQDETRRLREKHSPRKFAVGEEFLFLGANYRLVIQPSQGPDLIFENGFFIAESHASIARQIITDWYIARAREIIFGRVSFYARKEGLDCKRIRISSARRRWGSCSHNGSLNFSWRLVMAPVDIIDYVVVHELAHLRVRNHSSNFWALVESILPDYRARRKWLGDNERLFKFE